MLQGSGNRVRTHTRGGQRAFFEDAPPRKLLSEMLDTLEAPSTDTPFQPTADQQRVLDTLRRRGFGELFDELIRTAPAQQSAHTERFRALKRLFRHLATDKSVQQLMPHKLACRGDLFANLSSLDLTRQSPILAAVITHTRTTRGGYGLGITYAWRDLASTRSLY